MTILKTSLKFIRDFGIFLFLISLCEQVLQTHQKPPDFLDEGATYLDDFLFLTPRLGKSGGSIRSKSPTFIVVLNWFWCFVNDDCADGSALFLETLVGFNCSWYQLGSFWCFPDVALMTIIGSSHHSDAPLLPTMQCHSQSNQLSGCYFFSCL